MFLVMNVFRTKIQSDNLWIFKTEKGKCPIVVLCCHNAYCFVYKNRFTKLTAI